MTPPAAHGRGYLLLLEPDGESADAMNPGRVLAFCSEAE